MSTTSPPFPFSILLTIPAFLLGVFCSAPVNAQHTVTGDVIDAERGTALPGVRIDVPGTETETSTHSNGGFTLEVPSDHKTLTVSLVGYQKKRVPVDGHSQLRVSLRPVVTATEGNAVNVGYQRQTIETMIGSITQVSGKELNRIPSTTLGQSLQGMLPGVFGIHPSGRPGYDASDLWIRGAEAPNDLSPLVVIDGVPGRQGGLARLDPANIDRISVRKDAATIYGSRAANGVILVETKEGRAGETQISVNVERSYAQPTVLPEMADAPTYMQMTNELAEYRNVQPEFSREDVQQTQELIQSGEISESYRYHNTDWYEVALKDVTQETSMNVSATGGGESVQYRVALNGLTEDDILASSTSGYDQLGIRNNLNGALSDNLDLSFDLHGRLERRSTPPWPNGRNAAWEMLQRGKPTDPAVWPNGKPGPALEAGINPLVANETGYNNNTLYYLQSNLSLDVDIPSVEGWTAEGTVAYDYSSLGEERWQKPWTLYSLQGFDTNGDPILQGSQVGVPDPRLTEENRDAKDVLFRLTSSYERSFGKHSSRFLLGAERQSTNTDTSSIFERFSDAGIIENPPPGEASQRDSYRSNWQSARLNVFGRANYSYRKKYLLEVSARYDGSYLFPENNRLGFFPSVSAGWRIAQDEWFSSATAGVFDRLKIRSSYGRVGNDQEWRLPYRDLSGKLSTKFDVGLGGALLDHRFSFDLTYFVQEIHSFRRPRRVNPSNFVSYSPGTMARVNSRGVEGQINISQRLSEAVTIRVGGHLTYAQNRVTHTDEAEEVPAWQKQEGAPWGTDLYYVSDGIWPTQEEIDRAEQNCPNDNLCHFPGARPGDIRFKDLNGDGQITEEDRKRVDENSRPDVMGAMHLEATIGPFDAWVLFQGAAQVNRYVFTKSAGTFGNYFQHFAEHRWTPEDTEASGPRAYHRTNPYWAANANTYFLRNARYLRVKSARMGYTLPDSWTRQIGIEQLQLYLSGRNLATFTPLPVMDPEVRNAAAHVYPLEQTYTIGLQMQL